MMSDFDLVSSSDGLIEERVKVDRKRFEQMLGENSTIGCDADSFFQRVMSSTNTQIMWPPKLKPGTKSKKDPHVRITGSPNSINAAKEIIFEQLDTRRNRVTLKMDVAFTDHSHIIGKGGRSIQRVMDETGCHIHFPDSNRTNTAEKSNQVSIAGSAEGVEQSRCRIREMLPITLQFDLPLNNGLHSPPTLDPQSPQLQVIQQTYGITITFRYDGSKCNNNSYFASSRIITVAIRGARSHLFGLRQGLSVLIEYLTGFRGNTIIVPLTMTIDVAVQHHSFIAGRANCNLTSIMQATGATITMPDNITSKTTITLRGPNFESVYQAWQDLLGHLPLILIFDLKEGQDLDPAQVTRLMEQMRQISILIKPKQRQNTKSIVVRGPEKDSRLLFEVRKQLLKLDDEALAPIDQLKSKQQQQQQHHQLLRPILEQQQQNILSRQGQQQVTALQQQSQPFQHQQQQQQQSQQQSQQQQSHQQQQQPNVELQMQAIKAILEPNLQKARQPTPYWAGFGFSKSVSEPMIGERASASSIFSSNLLDERRISYADENAINNVTSSLQTLRLVDQRQKQQKQAGLFNNLNLIDLNNNSPVCTPANSSNVASSTNANTTNNNTNNNSNSNNQQKITSCLRLAVFLSRIGLIEHLGLFTQRDIDLETLLKLGENELAELGLSYVHRRKLAIAIAEVKSMLQTEQRGLSTFDAAPGAERSRRQKTNTTQDSLDEAWPM